jgi:putative DNA primase/helicase
MHKDFFEFTPQFKPLISGNHRPRLRSVGLAMRRRVNMIPFAVKISDDERDDRLAEKLKDEWPGILQWLIDGCLAWQEQGLAPPEAVVRATDAYFAGEDGYSDWITDRCDVMAGFWSRSSDLFSSWRDWAEKAGQHPGDNKRFREEMERLGFTHRHLKTGIGGLEREPAAATKTGPGILRAQLAENGADAAEIDILLNERVELNAMASDDFIAVIERQLVA